MNNYEALTTDALKHLDYSTQFELKKISLHQLLQPYYNLEIDAFTSPVQHYRMRAEFRIWHEGSDTYHIMFDQQSKAQYRVDNLKSACVLINEAMTNIIEFILKSPVLRNKLFQIDYLATTTDELVISLLYHKKLSQIWEQEARLLRNAITKSLGNKGEVNIIGRARKQKIVLDHDYATETLTIKQQKYSFKQIENSFTQPNAIINARMIEWVIDNISQPNTDLLELYCGAGNFSIPLSRHFKKVLATEISKTSVNAAQVNIRENNINNLTIARLSSEEFVEAFNKVREFKRLADIDLNGYNFSTVLVDPPRAGLDDTTLSLVAGFDTIIYISCNPNTLLDNLAVLCDHQSGSHTVVKAALFDQFPYTHHIESGVILKKRT